MVLQLDEFRFGGTVAERHVLKFALASRVAYWAIEGMVAEQKLNHALAGLANLIAVSGDDHAVGDLSGAGSLQLRHLLDFNEAHATCALEGETGVVAKRGYFDTNALAGFDEKRSRGRGYLPAINCDRYVCHLDPETLSCHCRSAIRG